MKKTSRMSPVVEIFPSIQGEGRSLGVPSIFVRFFGCTLRCQFNSKECDTPYAVYEYKKYKNYQFYSPINVAKHIQEKFKNIKHIVFTGGEPLLHQKFIKNLMKILKTSDTYTAEVETNGTILPSYEMAQHIQHFNVSAKLKSSNQKSPHYNAKRICPKALCEFKKYYSYYKFVVSSPDDLKEIKNIVKKYPLYGIYLMPQGTTRNEIIENSKDVVKLCIENAHNNYIFSPREHIMLWDKMRGV